MKVNAFIFSCVFFLAWDQIGIAQHRIESVEALQYREGRYQLRITLADSLPDSLLLDLKKYNLREKADGKLISLPEIRKWSRKPGKGVRFPGVDITYKKEYIIQFEDAKATIDRSSFTLREGQKGFDEFEGDKRIAWHKSLKPKIAQGKNTISEIGDIGFDFSLSAKLPRKFEFDFNSSTTLNKDDPTNHFNLNLFWRTDLLLPARQFGIRPISLSVHENATQALRFHDVSFSATTTVVLWPFKGIQPVFATVGLDEAFRINFDGEDFDDPRLNVQVQWGMVGLLGKGSSFFINWQLWRRFDNLGNPRINPNEKKERQLIEVEFVLPLVEGKNLTVKYADGNFAPTFEDDTTLQIGFEFLLGQKPITIPLGKKE